MITLIPEYSYSLPSRSQAREIFNVNAENWSEWFTAEAVTALNDLVSAVNTIIPGIQVFEPVAPWASSTVYAMWDLVVGSDGYTYRSKSGSNQSHDPTTDSGSYWVLVGQPVYATDEQALDGIKEDLSINPATLTYVLSSVMPFRNFQAKTSSGSMPWPTGADFIFTIVKAAGGGGGYISTNTAGAGGEGGTVFGFIPREKGNGTASEQIVWGVGSRGTPQTASVAATAGGSSFAGYSNNYSEAFLAYGGSAAVGRAGGDGGYPHAPTGEMSGWGAYGIRGAKGGDGENSSTSARVFGPGMWAGQAAGDDSGQWGQGGNGSAANGSTAASYGGYGGVILIW